MPQLNTVRFERGSNKYVCKSYNSVTSLKCSQCDLNVNVIKNGETTIHLLSNKAKSNVSSVLMEKTTYVRCMRSHFILLLKLSIHVI